MANARLNVFEHRDLASDDDIWRVIDDLKDENVRLRRQLEYIAHYRPLNGDRIRGFYSVRLYAWECLYGPLSPGLKWNPKKPQSDDVPSGISTSRRRGS